MDDFDELNLKSSIVLDLLKEEGFVIENQCDNLEKCKYVCHKLFNYVVLRDVPPSEIVQWIIRSVKKTRNDKKRNVLYNFELKRTIVPNSLCIKVKFYI